MKIVADENLKDIERHFGRHGDIQLLAGRKIVSDSVKDADVLLVRSVTKVAKSLLDKSTVKFVGTATSGTDHVDIEYLKSRDIVFAHAHGSNSQAVVDYCISAVYSPAAQEQGHEIKTAGIVGLGAVGLSLARKLRLLAYQVVYFDPLLDIKKRHEAEDLGLKCTASLAEVFQCDLVSIHTPLSHGGNFATFHMIDGELLDRLPEGGILINASRGEVIDENALLQFLRARPDVFSVLDVWENEPYINNELVSLASIATPHMAGYSRRGKALATKMLGDAYSNFLGVAIEPNEGDQDGLRRELHAEKEQFSIAELMHLAMPIADWSAEFKTQLRLSSDKSSVFDAYRKTQINRAEIADFTCRKSNFNVEESSVLEKLGFLVSP